MPPCGGHERLSDTIHSVYLLFIVLYYLLYIYLLLREKKKKKKRLKKKKKRKCIYCVPVVTFGVMNNNYIT